MASNFSEPSNTDRDGPPRERRGGRGGGRPYRRRGCYFCETKEAIDYKNVALLRRFVGDSGRIEARRKSMVCAKHQRRVSIAIKRARFLALLPYAVVRRIHG